MEKIILLSLTLALALVLNGCATQVPTERLVYKKIPLELPIKPTIPVIKGSDLRCLSPDTQWELLNRDMILKNYIIDLEETIKSTH